jgi:metallophosphoesterase superfamily enzyme
VWIKAACNTIELTRVLLQKHGIKIHDSPETTFRKHYELKPGSSQLFIMPSFNDFLGGKPLNERRHFRKTEREMVTGPVLRTAAVDMNDAEAYLLDGTFLGTLEQLRSLS